MPAVSVLMPAYNAQTYICEAVESVLAQTFLDFEFIIIDDCSSDRTWSIIQEFAQKDQRIRAIQNERNWGVSDTLNLGIDLAKGKYIARMDADDWSYPQRLQLQYDFLEQNPHVGIVGAGLEICDENMKTRNIRHYHQSDEQIRKHIFRYSPFGHPVVMYRTETAKNAGYYDNSYGPGQDYNMWFRIGKITKLANLNQVLLRYRENPNSDSLSGPKIRQTIAATLKIRREAIKRYGYRMSFGDKVAFWLTKIVAILPGKIIINLFYFLRKFS